VCVATENGFIFWGGGVVLVGLGGFFAVFVVVVCGVGVVFCWSLLLFGVVLCCVLSALYPYPVPVFFNIKLPVLKRLKVFKHT
jgi:hypothetical protein